MKKIYILIVFLFMIALFAWGCKKNNEETKNPTETKTEAQTPTKATVDRKPLPLKPFYIDSNHQTETEK